MMSSCLHLQTNGPKRLLILSINNLLCYFPHSVVCHENARIFTRNIDRSKVEVKVRVEHFLSMTFNYFYIGMWSHTSNLRMCLKFFPCSCLKILFSFGDVNNVPKHLVKFHSSPVIIQRI